MTLKRAEMIQAIKRDYPNLPEYLINVTLKMHEKNPDWFRDDKKNADKMKKKGKTQPKKEIKTQYLGNVEIIEPQLQDDGGSKVANNNPIVVGFD